MANTSPAVISWIVAALSGLVFHLVITVLAVNDWKAVPKTPQYEAVIITAKANLRLFAGLAIVQLSWSVAGFTALLAVPGHSTPIQQMLIIGGLLLPSYILPSLALLELLDRRRATSKLREEGSE